MIILLSYLYFYEVIQIVVRMLKIEMLNYTFQILIILGQRSRPRNGMRGPVPRNGVSTYLSVSNIKLKLLIKSE